MTSPPKVDPAIAALASAPGPEGVLFRLVEKWNPEGIGEWLHDEFVRQTPPHELTRALGNMLAVGALGLAMQMSNPINAGKDIVAHFQTALQNKVNRHNATTKGGIFVPTPGEMMNGGR